MACIFPVEEGMAGVAGMKGWWQRAWLLNKCASMEGDCERTARYLQANSTVLPGCGCGAFPSRGTSFVAL